MSGFIKVVDAAEQLAGGPNCSDEEFEMWVGVLRADLIKLGALAPSYGSLHALGGWAPVTQLDLDCNRYLGDDGLRLRIPVARFDAWRAENGFRPQTAPPAVDAPDAPSAPNPSRERQPPHQPDQEQEILRALRELKYDPMNLPRWKNSKAALGINAKQDARDTLKWTSQKVFDLAWERLRKKKALRFAGEAT